MWSGYVLIQIVNHGLAWKVFYSESNSSLPKTVARLCARVPHTATVCPLVNQSVDVSKLLLRLLLLLLVQFLLLLLPLHYNNQQTWPNILANIGSLSVGIITAPVSTTPTPAIFPPAPAPLSPDPVSPALAPPDSTPVLTAHSPTAPDPTHVISTSHPSSRLVTPDYISSAMTCPRSTFYRSYFNLV